MDRWKRLSQSWLIVPLVILGSVCVFWATAADKRPVDVSKQHTALTMGPSSELRASQIRRARVAADLPAPRLLPHVEESQPRVESAATPASDPVHMVAFPLDADNPANFIEPNAIGSEVAETPLPPRPLPTDGQAASESPAYAQRAHQPDEEESGPRYSWLLEGQGDVPVGQHCRSHELELIARQADAHTRRGFDLAGRRAYYSARSEFIKALRLVAQGLDVEHQTSVHGLALRAGLTALDEADDFVLPGTQLEAELNYKDIVERHSTPVLKLSCPQTLTSIEALRRYYGFAQYQLAVAAGREVAGSMALHALAKLYASSEDNPTLTIVSAKSKAMTCFQAALVAYPKNYMASNDLGVLLANSGRYGDARQILEGSVAICPHSKTWHNLVVVYRELGMHQAAAVAEQNRQSSHEQELAQRNSRSPGASDPRVVWLSPEEFAQTYAQTPDARQPLPVRSGAAMSETSSHVSTPVQPAEEKSSAVGKEKSTGWSWNIFKNVLK